MTHPTDPDDSPRRSPGRPNWVASDAPPGPRRIEPYPLARQPDGRAFTIDEARAHLVEAIAAVPRARVVATSGTRVVAEFPSAFFGFVDDARFDIRAAAETIEVFSGARTGFWDFGVNRRRLGSIRRRLEQRGLVSGPVSAPGADDEADVSWAPIAIPIDGTLDLHAFDPREIDRLLPDYLEACRARGLLEVRVVHGKGQGILKARVTSLLGRLEMVARHRPAGEEAGGWGATLVTLHPPGEPRSGGPAA